MTAKSSDQSQELEILRSLTTLFQQTNFTEHIAQLLDEFVHRGPNGDHQCSVLELQGQSLDKVLSESYHCGDQLEPCWILKWLRQVLQAATGIYEARYIHRGTLTDSCLGVSDTSLVCSRHKREHGVYLQ